MSVMFQRWDPWTELAGLHNTMDRIFGDVFGNGGRQGGGEDNQGRRWSTFLPVNVIEADTGYELTAPVPGLGPDDIEVTFADGVLTIKAEQKRRTEQRGQLLRREFVWGSSMRQLSLSGEVDPEKIEAHVNNGLLTVRVPKAAAAQPKRIEIGSGATKPLVGAGKST